MQQAAGASDDGRLGPDGAREPDGAPDAADPVRPPGPAGSTAVPDPAVTDHALLAGPADVHVDEPLLPARVHRPADLIRFLFGLVALTLCFFLAGFAKATTAGLQTDVQQSDLLRGLNGASHITTVVIAFTASIALLVLPVAFAVERLVKRDGLRVADGVLAAVLAHGAALAVDLWVENGAPDSVVVALTYATGGGRTDAVHGYLAPVIAYMCAVGLTRRPRWRIVLWFVIILDGASALISGYSTAMSLLVTVVLGWTVAYGTLYAIGAPNVRPTGTTLLAGLRRLGFTPVSATRAPDAPDETRHYRVICEDGRILDIAVLDREQQASSFFYRLWRRIQLRVLLPRRSLLSLRQTLEHEALLSYAAAASGANVPELVASSELGPDAVMLVYDHIAARPLPQVPDEELTDHVLRGVWRQLARLVRRRIAHRSLVSQSILIDESGTAFLTNVRHGEIAAGELVLRMDIAELLCTLALRVGPERSVRAATDVLGADTVASALPVLQPVGLSRETRGELKQLNRQLAAERRERQEQEAREAREARDRRRAAGQQADGPVSVVKAAAAEPGPPAGAHAVAEPDGAGGAPDGDEYAAEPPELLSRIRHEVLRLQPRAPVEPVRLQRIKPRTVISFIALAVAAYLLLPSLAQIDLVTVFTEADWKWVLLAAFCSVMTYIGATMNMLGFVPERVPRIRAFMTQVAGSFVKVVLPAAVGGVALNTRFLQRNGVRPGLAVASVGASQLVGASIHIVMLLVLGLVTGTKSAELPSSKTVLFVLLAIAVVVLLLGAIPPARKFLLSRVRPLFSGVLPRMLDIVQKPQKLLEGAGGTVVLTAGFIGCLDASVYAFGGHIDFVSCAVVFLAGNAVGSAVPTPGGIGTVETALIAGLVGIGGVPKEVATAAVLLHRLMTFWLPILPGWFCFTFLQRKQSL